jgi:hypothetical protein
VRLPLSLAAQVVLIIQALVLQQYKLASLRPNVAVSVLAARRIVAAPIAADKYFMANYLI